jgi:beta-mannosidase
MLPLTALLFAMAASATDTGLRDVPIAGDEVVYLDAEVWHVQGAGFSFPSTSVPGDLFTELENAQVIPDPLVELNWLQNTSLWASNVWNYSTTIDPPEGMNSLLVFDGIKMGAYVFVDGALAATVVDQFVRTVIPVAPGLHSVVVSFDPKLFVQGRYMACTGGWDWAPYSPETQPAVPDTAWVFSKGIWKSVYLVSTASVTIEYLLPQTFYLGPYPIARLQEGQHGGFRVDVNTFLWSPEPITGQLVVNTEWGQSVSTPTLTLPAGRSNTTVSVSAAAGDIRLWWPNGLGEQPLFWVTAEFIPQGRSRGVLVTRQVGFKFLVLVTGNDTAPGYVANNTHTDGTDSMGMMFRVNGAAFFARGANMIPLDEMEGRVNSTAVRVMVQSAADANFNMLRVWGGGVFQYDVFYQACDEWGILIYHDMQFAQSGHSPSETPIQRQEFQHQVRRIAPHVSLGLWDGCNECHVVIGTPTGIYATFVLTTVVGEDQSHIVWPSCPSNGWKAGVNRLTCMPNGSPLGLLPQARAPPGGEDDSPPIETHGPYQHGTGFPAVNNGNGQLVLFDANLPITVTLQPTGIGLPNVFASEFGCVSPSSFEAMSATLTPQHWAMHAGQPDDSCSDAWNAVCTGGNVMAQRNYPMDSLLEVYWRAGSSQWLNTTGVKAFQQQLWQGMIAQALNIKSNIESRRQQNQFGSLVWQFGEIWPTVSAWFER